MCFNILKIVQRGLSISPHSFASQINLQGMIQDVKIPQNKKQFDEYELMNEQSYHSSIYSLLVSAIDAGARGP